MKKDIKKFNYKKLAVDILVDILACGIASMGIYNFASAANFPLTGFTGIAMIINRITGLPMGAMLLVLNIPVAILCYKVLGKRYFLNSLKSMAILSIMLDYVAPHFPVFTGEKLLAAIAAGSLAGVGYGLIYTRGSSTGGIDFITFSVKSKRPYISIGRIAFIIDSLIVVLGTLVVSKSVEGLLYGLIISFIASTVVDKIMYGLSAGKMTLIVTDKAQEVAEVINDTASRGATFLRAQGSYSEVEKNVVMCASNTKQMYLIRDAVKEVDPSAFMIILDSSEVMGQGFEKKTI